MVMTLPSMNNLLSLESIPEPNWGPNGKEVFRRTYSRTKADGSRETWDDTVRRVIKGNVSLVPEGRIDQGEEDELYDLLYNFRALPAGRHLWMSGVEGRQFLFNCYVSGWGDNLSEHFAFTFNQLMEGGGVGANYSAKYLDKYSVNTPTRVHIVCSDQHENYRDLLEAGLLSSEYDSAWDGAYEIEDSREGWTGGLVWVIDRATGNYDRALDLVLDVSNIRAAGKRIKTFGGTSAGPVPFAKMMKQIGFLLNEAYEEGTFIGPIAMDMDHAIATCVVSGNVRRSARMSIMHWDDPWIDWFLNSKADGHEHWSTNISVEIDDEFIKFINQPFADSERSKKASEIYEAIVAGMLRNGEPGIWNSSLSNVGEPNQVIATNPCGEIALEAWENCNLGHINLSAFVRMDGSVDWDGLSRAHELMARFLIRATYGDITNEKTQEVVNRNRRIGVGHFGFADFLAKQGIKYSECWKNLELSSNLWLLRGVVKGTAYQYAHELRIPVPVKSTTVAPTGTISKLPGVNGEGIHPIFAKYYIQRIRFSTVDPDQAIQLREYQEAGFSILPDPKVPNTMVVEIPMKSSLLQELEDRGIDTSILEDAHEIPFADFLRVQEMYQGSWADNAVSYTINLNPVGKTVAGIMEELRPFLPNLKGTTVFPERGYELAPYQRVDRVTFEALRGSQAVLGDAVDEDCASGACPVR
jgi:ribonucleoside-triphosphate reductase